LHLTSTPALAVADLYVAPPSAPAPHVLLPQFTGSGQEYFRIWIVNLLLTLATLGIYSAWAKVRRLQYFDRNTSLDGAVFDFRGDPKAILRGRLLALVLLVAYHYAFGFDVPVGLAILGVLLLALPFLMRGALRFRLHNTYYRGLPLGFTGTVRGAYRACLPVLLTFLLPAVAATVAPDDPVIVLAASAPYLAWPWIHAGMKRYQHRHLHYGGLDPEYDVSGLQFWEQYLKSTGLLIAVMAVMLTLVIGGAFAVEKLGHIHGAAAWAPFMGGIAGLYAFYLAAGPFMQVRIGNLTWSNTRFPGVTIASTMKTWPFLKLQTVNVMLTLMTLGLFRPFAAVRVYRYRLDHVSLHVAGDLVARTSALAPPRSNAAGDGAADFLGIDLSW
jgi:uncharacterized membrane protein YjgN (DUF898 family)